MNVILQASNTLKQLALLLVNVFAILLLLIDVVILVENLEQALLIDGVFLLGCASKAMVGFSPTVWASYERTGWIAEFLMICTIALIFKNIEMKKTTEQKIEKIIMVALVILMIWGMHYNYATTFLIRA